MFLYLKKYKKIFIILVIVFFIILVIFFIKSFLLQKSINRKLNYQKNKQQEKDYSNQKEIWSENKAYFTYDVKKIDKDTYLVSIILNGDNNTLVDAVELSLLYNKDIVKIEELISGKSFLMYPRQQITDNKILLSAVSQIKNNKIVYASLNSNFAEIKIKFNQKPFPEKIFHIGGETGIYYSGKNIFDVEKSFTKIVL